MGIRQSHYHILYSIKDTPSIALNFSGSQIIPQAGTWLKFRWMESQRLLSYEGEKKQAWFIKDFFENNWDQ